MGSSKGLALTILALTLLAASACDRKASKDAKGAAPPPPPTVIVTQVEQRTVPIVRDFVARTEAIPTVEIRARVAAVLEKARYPVAILDCPGADPDRIALTGDRRFKVQGLDWAAVDADVVATLAPLEDIPG